MYSSSLKGTISTMLIETGPKCQIMNWYADGVCDVVNNVEECDFDGNDCNPDCPQPVLAGDGTCHLENNVTECTSPNQLWSCIDVSKRGFSAVLTKQKKKSLEVSFGWSYFNYCMRFKPLTFEMRLLFLGAIVLP